MRIYRESATCPITVNFNPVGDKEYSTDLEISFNDLTQQISQNYNLVGESGSYGYISVADEEGTPVKANKDLDQGNFIIGTTQTITLLLKNFGHGAIENITINDSTIQSTAGGDILIDEDKRRVLNSSCLADGLSIQPGETCEISYEVDVIKENISSISVNITYNNPDDQKEYATRILYRGTPPPWLLESL